MSYTFKSDAYGYMLYYKGQPIGGAGTLERKPKHWRHRQADVKMHADSARREIAQLEAGYGQKRLRDAVNAIDRKETMAT
jgi:hypothetical protein